MKRITKHKLLFGALAAALPLFVVSCLYFDNISQPERALPGSEIEITAQLRVEPGTNDKGRLVFAMLVPKAWNAAETASLSVTTKDYSQNKNGDPEVVNEPLEPMPAGEKDPKTGKPWSEAFMQVMGLGDNAGLPEQTEMEWVVWRSSTAFEIWDKITNPDNTETKFNPVHADVNIRLKTGSEPLTCYLGYSYGYDNYGLSVDEKRHADAQFKSLTVSDRVFSTTPSVFRYGDVFGITFSPSGTALEGAPEIYLCGTAVHDGGQRTEIKTAGDKNRMTPVEGRFEKFFWPKDLFGLPNDAVIEELHFHFINADGSIAVMDDENGGGEFFVEQSAE